MLGLKPVSIANWRTTAISGLAALSALPVMRITAPAWLKHTVHSYRIQAKKSKAAMDVIVGVHLISSFASLGVLRRSMQRRLSMVVASFYNTYDPVPVFPKYNSR